MSVHSAGAVGISFVLHPRFLHRPCRLIFSSTGRLRWRCPVSGDWDPEADLWPPACACDLSTVSFQWGAGTPPICVPGSPRRPRPVPPGEGWAQVDVPLRWPLLVLCPAWWTVGPPARWQGSGGLGQGRSAECACGAPASRSPMQGSRGAPDSQGPSLSRPWPWPVGRVSSGATRTWAVFPRGERLSVCLERPTPRPREHA